MTCPPHPSACQNANYHRAPARVTRPHDGKRNVTIACPTCGKGVRVQVASSKFVAQRRAARGFLAALVAGDSSMELRPNLPSGEPDADNLISSGGPSIEYLTIDTSQGQSRWARKVKMDQPQSLYGAAWVGCQLNNRLWQTARIRYVKQKPEGINFFAKATYEEVIKSSGKGEGIEIGEMAIHLLYYEEPGKDPGNPK